MRTDIINVIQQQPCTSMGMSLDKPPYVGRTVTFTITVQPMTESYPVEVRDQNNNLIGARMTSGGTCTVDWNTTGWTEGAYIISATTTGCSTSLPLTLSPACTSVNMVANKTFSLIGETIIFDITANPMTYSYPVELRDQNNNLIGSCNTSGGTCSWSWNTTGLNIGTYTITARVVVDGLVLCQKTIDITLVACTSMNLSADKTSAYIGETIIFTTTVEPSTRSYMVTFGDENNNLVAPACTTSDGTCFSNWDTGLIRPTAGTHIINAFAGALGVVCRSSIPITILPACEVMNLSAKTISYVGETVTLNITTYPSTQSYPVEVRDQNNNLIGICTTSNGTCYVDLNTTGWTAGTYNIRATTIGGCGAQIPITLIPTCALVNITPSKISANIGDLIIFDISVIPISQSFNVQLKDQNDNLIGNVCTTSDGTCSISWNTTGLSEGPYTITARVIDGAAGQCISTPITVTLASQTNLLSIGTIAMMGLAGMVLYMLHKK